MKIAFDKIVGKTDRYDLEAVGWSPEELGSFTVHTTPWISVCRLDPETVMLKGELKGTLQGLCGRCGKQVDSEIESCFEYVVTGKKEESSDLQEVECSDDDVNTLYLVQPEIDTDEILREQAYLESPVRMLCSESCKGICQGCGAQLNSENCSCSADYSDSPFAILGNINKK
ncbi:YceD family protein [Desulforhopalus sp. 52FAK]